MKRACRELNGVFKIDLKKNINKINFTCAIIFLFISGFIAQMSIWNYSGQAEKKTNFIKVEKKKFDRYINYKQYGSYGFMVSIENSPLCILFDNSSCFNDVEIFIDNGVRFKINKPLNDGNIFKNPTGGSVDQSWFTLIFFSGLILAWCFSTIRKSKEYFKFLINFASLRSVFFGVFLSRGILILFFLFFKLLISIGLFFVNGINIFPEIESLLTFLLIEYLTMLFFLVVGYIISTIKNTAKAAVTAVILWLIFILVYPGALNTAFSQKAASDIKSQHQKQLRKLEILTVFEKLISEKSKKARTREEMIEINRELTEKYLDEGFREIEDLDKKMVEDIQKYANKFHLLNIFFPVTFYKSVNNELSSMGYNEYIHFYRNNLEKYKEFVHFYFDNMLYKKNPKVVPFLKDDEYIFKAKPSLPEFFGAGLLYNILLLIALIWVSYYRFKRFIFPKPEHAAAFKEINFQFTTGKHLSHFCRNKDFSSQVYNVFMGMGKKRKFSGKISIDNKNIISDEKLDFVYLPNPDVIPQNIKAGYLLEFAGKLLNIPKPEINKIREESGEMMGEKLADLNNLKKVELFFKIAALKKSKIYLFNDLSLAFPPKDLKKMFEELKNILIIEFTSVSLMHSRYYYYSVIALEDSVYQESKMGV